ncbi:MAG: GNAT family N-acetyltransferase [Bacteroidota bacterium]
MSAFSVIIAGVEHLCYAQRVGKLLATSAKARQTGRGWRDPVFIAEKMLDGLAIIALQNDQLAGFCYLQTYEQDRFVAHSGLVVAPTFRNQRLARRIKALALKLSNQRFPNATLFSITTSPAVLKMNQELGYEAVHYKALPQSNSFWDGCKTCPNYDILQSKKQQLCFCTALMRPAKDLKPAFDLSALILQHHE